MIRALFPAVAALALAAAQAPAPSAAVPVRPTDLDSNGHVNNAVYVEYLQCGRWAWLDRVGLPRATLRAAGITVVVARLEVDFEREIGEGDVATVAVAVERVGDKSLTLTQAIVRSDGVRAARAKVVLVAFDPATRRSREWPPAARAALDAAKGAR